MFIADIHENTELADVARLFFGDAFPFVSMTVEDDVFTVFVADKTYCYRYNDCVYSIIPNDRRIGRLSKIALYDALSAYTERKMPWGALTGVRPTKLFYECLNAGKTADETAQILQIVYRVSASRAEILNTIVRAQNGKINFPSDFINLYIHIPYCTTRCTYCSFVSALIEKNRAQSNEYVRLLCDEINRSIRFLRENGKRILSVYIGGGTPTALGADLLDRVLTCVDRFDCEFTCEAGRPDTITDDAAKVMKTHNVTRVCVNPQTLNDATLAAIGRSHTADDFFRAYEIIKKFGFDINCDLIAGLDMETADDFARSFDGIKSLKPQNITVHSLSKKNGSVIRYDASENSNAASMIDYALGHADEYCPYYLYRQKRQSCNLENIGLSLSGKECINNITTMEETVGVMACGAGAISKIVLNGQIGRFANMRDTLLYIKNYDEKVSAKLDYFTKQFR